MNDSLGICVLKHFLATVEDSEVKDILEFAINMVEEQMQVINVIEIAQIYSNLQVNYIGKSLLTGFMQA